MSLGNATIDRGFSPPLSYGPVYLWEMLEVRTQSCSSLTRVRGGLSERCPHWLRDQATTELFIRLLVYLFPRWINTEVKVEMKLLNAQRKGYLWSPQHFLHWKNGSSNRGEHLEIPELKIYMEIVAWGCYHDLYNMNNKNPCYFFNVHVPIIISRNRHPVLLLFSLFPEQWCSFVPIGSLQQKGESSQPIENKSQRRNERSQSPGTPSVIINPYRGYAAWRHVSHSNWIIDFSYSNTHALTHIWRGVGGVVT